MGVDMAVVIVLGSLVYLTVAGARLVWSPTTFTWPMCRSGSPSWSSSRSRCSI